jgi:hypothetical protein
MVNALISAANRGVVVPTFDGQNLPANRLVTDYVRLTSADWND